MVQCIVYCRLGLLGGTGMDSGLDWRAGSGYVGFGSWDGGVDSGLNSGVDSGGGSEEESGVDSWVGSG